ncbi:hypothetical protein GWI33_009863, partial [Rhynchophorus ferrugineus]
ELPTLHMFELSSSSAVIGDEIYIRLLMFPVCPTKAEYGRIDKYREKLNTMCLDVTPGYNQFRTEN